MSDKYISFLTDDDEDSRAFRARRLELLVREMGDSPAWLVPGGLVSLSAIEEARLAYLHGLDIATVLLSQLAIEHMLAGLLRQSGKTGRWSFGQILSLAKGDRLISDAEFDLLERLRTSRNPYVHSRAPLTTGTLAARMSTGDGPYELMAEDATDAITTLLRLLARHPFSYGRIEGPEAQRTDGSCDSYPPVS